MTKLVEAGLVDPSWKNDRYRGFVTESVVTLAVRPGNPKNIRTWEDLVKPGVEIVTPNPQTSGGAKWNIMAAYGAQSDGGRAPERGFDYLRRFFGNVAVSDKSAREALQTFAGGKGDVLVAYENEAITAQNKGEKLDYVTPDDTIRIENPVAVTKDAQPKARAFADYLRTEPAQRVFIGEGYRPVVRDLRDEKRFPEPKGLFSIDDLGGWSRVNKEFFDEENGRVTRIQQEQLDGGG
jgi:sulfate transport system substrate-binding protein